MKIIHGSQSHGRKKVLERMGYKFEVMPANIDEKAIRLDDPVKLTLALSRAKAEALLPERKEPAILITSDQVVVCNGRILEKPVDDNEVRDFFHLYEKYPSETVTSVFVINTASGARAEGTDIARIWFQPPPAEVMGKYITSGDPFLHAGGFDHEHPLLRPYVIKIEGEPESVTGLPRRLTKELINRVK